jgi:hypothetical protein
MRLFGGGAWRASGRVAPCVLGACAAFLATAACAGLLGIDEPRDRDAMAPPPVGPADDAAADVDASTGGPDAPAASDADTGAPDAVVGPPGEAGGDSGGGGCKPDYVLCAGECCGYPANICCSGAGRSESCEATFGHPEEACPLNEIRCDDPGDCEATDQCCIGYDAVGGYSIAQCQHQGCAGGPIVCLSDKDCGGESCLAVPSTCSLSLKTCGGMCFH